MKSAKRPPVPRLTGPATEDLNGGNEDARDLWRHLTPGPGGLVPAIIQDHRSGQVLMLGYQDRQAFENSLTSGDVWFYSRSRRELWHKGATSGHYLRMRARPRLDCDGDALLYLVEPAGPACHTGEGSCFFRVMGPDGPEPVAAPGPEPTREPGPDLDRVPTRLAEIIAQRHAATSPEESYTARLFAAGLDKILKKLGEEATEVVLAAKNGDRANLVWELADLYYHAAVVMEQVGVTREDVLRELARRLPAGGGSTKAIPKSR